MTESGFNKLGDWACDGNARISVCIANFNGMECIEDCIRSVLHQQLPVPFEIIIHDDASTDDSLNLILETYPDIKVLASHINVGFCISNNRMVDHATGEYLLLLNNDAQLHPGSLSALYARSRKFESEILGLPQYSVSDGQLVDRGYEFDLFLNPIPQLRPGIRDVATVTGACLWIPRAIWDEVGGFPSWFGSVAEDIYLCQVARLLGYSIKVLDEPGFDHWIGKTLGGGKVIKNRLNTSVRRRALSERNKTEVMLICYPVLALVALMPLHLLFLLVEALFLLITGTSLRTLTVIYLKVPGSVYAHISDIKATRSRIQRLRRIPRISYLRRFRCMPWKLVLLIRFGLPAIRS